MSEGKVERDRQVEYDDLMGRNVAWVLDRLNELEELRSSLTELREAIEEHRQQGLRDSHEHGDALDYIDRAQENDKRLYAALTDSQEAEREEK